MLGDIVSIAAGFYKGYMGAGGVDVDPTYLAFVVGGSSAISGIGKAAKTAKENKENEENIFGQEKKRPLSEGAKFASISAVANSLEIALGYGIGWAAYKIIH